MIIFILRSMKRVGFYNTMKDTLKYYSLLSMISDSLANTCSHFKKRGSHCVFVTVDSRVM